MASSPSSIELDAVLFAVWAAAFFGTFVGMTFEGKTVMQRQNITMVNFTNIMFRGYSMLHFDLDRFADEALWYLGHVCFPPKRCERRSNSSP
jgi:hypothetical protein